MTQPTISKALKALEDELGKKLFERHSFSISLTQEGALLRDRSAECNVPKYVLQAIVDDMMHDIRVFFESEEGKREFEEWKAQREKKPSEGEKEHKKK